MIRKNRMVTYMPYKKPTLNLKRYMFPFYNPNPPYSMNTAAPGRDGDFLGIPLPNEKEVIPELTAEKRAFPTLSGIVNYIRRHVKIEDMLLVGLIILMLDESIEDDLLLIILIYILLF